MKANLELLNKYQLKRHLKFILLKIVILPKCNYAPLVDKSENFDDYDLIDSEVAKFIQ
jgi:hypothetical protein